MFSRISTTVVVAFSLSLGPLFAVVPPAAWKYRQEFQVADPGLIKLVLPEQTIDASKAGLDDVRVFDEAGKEVPYLIQAVFPPGVSIRAVRMFRVVLEPQVTVIHIDSGFDAPIDGILLETSALSFMKAVRVQASTDRQTWKEIGTGEPFFRQPGGESRMMFPIPSGAWPHLRLSLDDSRTDPIPISGVQLREAVKSHDQQNVTARILNRKEIGGITRLELDLGARNLSLSSIRIQTGDPLFTRLVHIQVREVTDRIVQERSVLSATIYRVAVAGQNVAEHLEIPIEKQIRSRELILLIENHGSPPLNIAAIDVYRRPVALVAMTTQSGRYTLYAGNPRATSPNYDLKLLAAQLEGTRPAETLPGALSINPGYDPPEPLPELQGKGMTLDISNWKYRKEVSVHDQKVQQLELDLEVMSRARFDYADLRLMHNGTQVPYILERTSLTHSLTPDVTEEQDKEHKSLSRWILKLPESSLQITQLICKSQTPLFQRTMRLYEKRGDDRGRKYDHSLGGAQWIQTSGTRIQSFAIWLSDRPATDTLILETDNGDNPSLQLNAFALHYPVHRLLFKAPAMNAVHLYFGNENAAPPQYDITLVAQQLLDEEKSQANLTKIEMMKESGWRSRIGNRAGALFWIALGIVVLVLFFALSRLLPKAST